MRESSSSASAVAEALGCGVDGIEGALRAMTRSQALARLAKGGVPAAPVRQPQEIALEPAVKDVDAICQQHFPNGKPYLAPLRYARANRDYLARIGL